MKGVVQDRKRVSGNAGGPPDIMIASSWGETTPEEADHCLMAALQND